MTTLHIDADKLAKLDHYQLTFHVGSDAEYAPAVASFKVSGALQHPTRQLEKGAECTVTVTDSDGVVICTADGYVSQIAFKENRPKDGPVWTERAHTIRLHVEDA